MRDIVVAILVFGSLPFILRHAWIGIIVWTWLGFMNPHRMAWGFIVDMPVAYIVALTTLVSLLLSREPKKIPWSRELVVLLMFVAWMTTTTFFAIYQTAAWEQLEKVLKIQLMIFVATMLINQPERLKVLVWTIVISISFYGVKGGIFTVLQGGVHRVYGPPGTFIGNNNEMGLALCMTVPLAYALYDMDKRAFVRAALLVTMLLTVLAAIGTQSRGALVSLVVMGAIFWWKSKQKFMTLLIGVAAVGLVIAIMPQEWYDRISTIREYESDASSMGRVAAWTMAINMASARPFGGGFESFTFDTFAIYNPSYGGSHDAHSIYFEVLGEHGYVGLVLFLLLLLFTWSTANRVRKRSEPLPEFRWLATLMRMTQVSVVAYMSAGAFLGMAYFDYIYNLVLIVVMGNLILSRGMKQAADDAVAVGVPPLRSELAHSGRVIVPGVTQ